LYDSSRGLDLKVAIEDADNSKETIKAPDRNQGP
jgi:hypothetical protein